MKIPLGSLGSLSKSGPAQDLNCSSDCVLLDRDLRCYSWGLFEPLSQLVGHSPECSYHPWYHWCLYSPHPVQLLLQLLVSLKLPMMLLSLGVVTSVLSMWSNSTLSVPQVFNTSFVTLCYYRGDKWTDNLLLNRGQPPTQTTSLLRLTPWEPTSHHYLPLSHLPHAR